MTRRPRPSLVPHHRCPIQGAPPVTPFTIRPHALEES